MKKLKLFIAYILVFFGYPNKMAEMVNEDPDRMDELVLSAVFKKKGEKACRSSK